MTQNLTMSGKHWLFLGLLSIIWAGSFIANEIALTHFGPFTVVAFRVTGGALTLIPVLFYTRQSLPMGLKIWGVLLFIGFFNNAVPFSLIVWGQQHIDAGLASVLNATTPIITVIFAQFLTKDEKISSRKLFGIGAGFAGILVLFNPGIITFSGNAFWGQLALLGSSAGYALGVIMLKKLAEMGMTTVQGALGQLIASSMIMLPLAQLTEGFLALPLPPQDVIISVITLGVFCSGVAYLLYFTLAREAGATNASLVTVTVPPFAIIMGVLMLGESFGINDLLGMMLIMLGLLIQSGYISLPKFGKKATEN